MNDRNQPPSAAVSPAGKNTNQRPAVGDYIMKIEEVPKEVRDYAINKISPKDADGNIQKDEKGKEMRAGISTAKENGSYYGSVILNNDKFIVQAVGKDRGYAVVHPKDKVELQGPTLATLDEQKRMNGFDVQIHYTGDRAKAYPYKAKETTAEQGEKALASKAKEAMTPETLIAKAQEYAAENIKNANQRTAFLKHMEAVTQQAFQRDTAPQQQASKPAPQKAQQTPEQAGKGIER
jgi:hypothetical protein